MVIKTRETPSGSVNLRRILPAETKASVGPFVLIEHFGPGGLQPGAGLHLSPSSEKGAVGLAYLFEGEIVFDDGSGLNQVIQAGAATFFDSVGDSNPVLRNPNTTKKLPKLDGIHAWIAVPADETGSTPAIGYQPAKNLPKVKIGDAAVNVVLGEIYGRQSPATRQNSTLCLICELPELSEFTPPGNYSELGMYVISGCLEIEGKHYLEGTMVVAAQGWPVKLRAKLPSRFLVIGSKGEG